MNAVWLRARSELRARIGAILVLALIVGVIGGVVIAAAAGARRTDTAYPRFNRVEHGLDFEVDVQAKTLADAERAVRAVARLPQVAESAETTLAAGRFDVPGAKRAGFVFPLVGPHGGLGTRVNKLKILEGRMFDPNAPDEIVPTFVIADELHLHVGQVVRFSYGSAFGERLPLDKNPPPPVRLRVVGIGAAPSMFKPLAGSTLPGIYLTPAFARAHPEYVPVRYFGIVVVLRHGFQDADAFVHGVKDLRERLSPGAKPKIGFNAHQQTLGIQQSTHVQAIALWMLAALVALAGLAVFGQALARQTFLESLEYPTLRSMGMSPSQLFVIGLIRCAVIGAIGAGVSVIVAYLFSTFTPTGVARIAEPSPGFAIDAPVFALGAVALALLVVVIGALPAWRGAVAEGGALGTIEPRTRRRSSSRGLLGRSPMAPSASAGVRMALDPGRGRTAVPVRTAMFGAALSLLAVSAALGFGASLNHLVATPGLSGANWDSIVFVPTEQGPRLERVLSSDRDVSGFSEGTITSLQVNGVPATAIATRQIEGDVTPSIVEGRLPRGFHEVMLGTETMRKIGVGIGDTVRIEGRDASLRMRVVGRVALPTFFFSFSRPGQGMAISLDAVRRLQSRSVSEGIGMFVRFAKGVPASRAADRIRGEVPRVFVLDVGQSGNVRNLSSVGDVPLILAGILSVMAALTLAHTLITTIRRRRLDLAILKTLGFFRRQISAAVAWQATTLAAVSVAIGVPLGIISGRWAWNVFADRLGVVPVAIVPLAVVLMAIPATILVANLLAVIPGRVASRLKAAPVLRSE